CAIERHKTCVFVQVKDEIPDKFDRNSLQNKGVATIITSKGTPEDRTALRTALSKVLAEYEAKQRTVDIEKAMKLALKEVDRAASDCKRGFKHKVPPGPMTMVQSHTDADKELLKKYYEDLEKHTAEATPEQVVSLEVPETILKKKLPSLEKGR